MDRQLALNLTSRQEREEAIDDYFGPLELARREVLVLRLLAGSGERLEINGQTASRISISKANAAELCSCAPGTFMKGVADLQRRGVLDVLRSTRPWTYLVNWSRVDKLEPPPPVDPAAGLALFAPDWSPESAQLSKFGDRSVTVRSPSGTRGGCAPTQNNKKPKTQQTIKNY